MGFKKLLKKNYKKKIKKIQNEAQVLAEKIQVNFLE